MARFACLLCLSSLVATPLLCVRVDKKGVLAKVDPEVVDPAKAAEAEANAALAKEALAAVAFGESTIAAGAKTSSPQDIAMKATEDAQEAEVADAAEAPGSQPWRLARRLSKEIADMFIVAENATAATVAKVADTAEASGIQPQRLAKRLSGAIADMAFANEVYPMGGGGALIVAESATAATEDAKVADAAEAPGIQPGRLAKRLSGAIADMAFANEGHPMWVGSPLIVAEKPAASKEEAIPAEAAKGEAAFEEGMTAAEAAQTALG